MGTQGEGRRGQARRASDAKRPSVLVLGDVPLGWDGQLAAFYDLTFTSEQSDCIALAERSHPDAIVVCGLADESTLLLEILSSSQETEGIPVVLISGEVDPDDRAIALEHGACDLISDQSSPRELSARIVSAMRSSEQLRNLKLGSGRDPVTGLLDRRSFFERLEEEMARSRRHPGPLSILLLEADNLEEMVADHGPAASDALLDQIAQILRQALRSSDGMFRYDGDRFAVILPETEIAAAHTVAKRGLELVSAIGYDGGVTVTLDGGDGVSASVGLAELDAAAPAIALVAKAEQALRLARESGGGVAWRADDPRRAGLGTEALAASLTEREWAVLAHLADRESEQEIAAKLGIRAGTVRSHKARIRRKLNVSPNLRLSDFARENLAKLVKRVKPGTIDESRTDGST